MALSGARKIAVMVVASVALFLLVLIVAALSQKRAAELRTREWIVHVLEHKFNSNVELADFHVQVFPRMTVSGAGLSLHYWAAPDAPPLIRIEHFSFDLGLLGVLHAPHRIERVHLKRMIIAIPPRGLRNKAVQPLDDKWNISDVVVDTIESEN